MYRHVVNLANPFTAYVFGGLFLAGLHMLRSSLLWGFLHLPNMMHCFLVPR
jgi:hypothetical protein